MKTDKEYSNPIKCKDHVGDFICSRMTLPLIVKSLSEDDRIIIQKIMRCDKKGYHIWTKLEVKKNDQRRKKISV